MGGPCDEMGVVKVEPIPTCTCMSTCTNNKHCFCKPSIMACKLHVLYTFACIKTFNDFCINCVKDRMLASYFTHLILFALYLYLPLSVETENGRDSDGTGLPLTISRETDFHGHIIPFSIT